MPEGMLAAFVQRGTSRAAYVTLRVGTLLRVLLPLAAIEASIPGDLRREGVGLAAATTAWLAIAMGQATFDGSWLAPIRPDRTLLLWQAVTTVPYLLLLPRRR